MNKYYQNDDNIKSDKSRVLIIVLSRFWLLFCDNFASFCYFKV